MCSDSEFILLPQTSKVIMEINLSVFFNANKLFQTFPKCHLFSSQVPTAVTVAEEQAALHPFRDNLKNALVLTKEKAFNF